MAQDSVAEMDPTTFSQTRHKVYMWAWRNARKDFLYGSPQSYWAAALNHNIITKQDYRFARDCYGSLWTYRGARAHIIQIRWRPKVAEILARKAKE